MDKVKYTVRNMVKEDVPKALEVWRETGMNQGINSLYIWLEVDPEAFKIVVTDEGEIIGVCGGTIHNDDLSVLGLYCVRKKYRGQGIGKKIWRDCLEHVGDRNACLFAVPEKAEIYRTRGGFPIVESKWHTIGFHTNLPIKIKKLSDAPPNGVYVEPFEELHLSLIYDYDKKLIGYDRKLILKLSFKQPDSRTYVAVKDGDCVGFGTIKISCQNVAQIGPLYVDDKEVAEVMLKKLISSLPQVHGLYMLTVSNNHAANELVKKIEMKVVKVPSRLYRKKAFNTADHDKIYALMDANFSPY